MPLPVPVLVMLVLVAALGVVIARFSRHYLAGEPGLPRYRRWLLVTLGAVTVLVIADDLLTMALAWTVTSLALHQLLMFYPDRPGARVAAHKKFLVSRLADVVLIAALVVLHLEVGSLELDAIAAASATMTPALEAAALLVVIAVALRSAQVPFHGWLTGVMEAPTPVSALLHAGVVNIGGYVLIRLAPLFAGATAAQTLLVAIGTATAVLAALVATTRPTVKTALAWSTCAQMGFMLVECGLGLWHLALLHLVAHSLYKAHAFLRAGSAVEDWRTRRRDRRALVAGAALVVVAYAAWHQLPALATPRADLTLAWAIALAGAALLAAVHLTPLARAVEPWIAAGLHLDERFTRLTFRLWPPRLPATPATPPAPAAQAAEA